MVSLHDRDARPIAKGRLGKPVEFGHKGQVVDNDDGIVLDHTVEQGNPPDAPQLAPAVQRVKKRAGRTPGTVTADRGYGEAEIDNQLTELGVKNVVIPRRGRTDPSAASRGTPKNLPPHRQMANRQRRPDQLPQTRLRLGPHPHRRHRRCPDLDRTRRSSPTTWSRSAPSPGNGRPPQAHRPAQPSATSAPDPAPLLFQVEVATSPRKRPGCPSGLDAAGSGNGPVSPLSQPFSGSVPVSSVMEAGQGVPDRAGRAGNWSIMRYRV